MMMAVEDSGNISNSQSNLRLVNISAIRGVIHLNCLSKQL